MKGESAEEKEVSSDGNGADNETEAIEEQGDEYIAIVNLSDIAYKSTIKGMSV